MEKMTRGGPPMFRVWIATYTDWHPCEWSQLPPSAIALEPVDDALYSAGEAALFLEGFNGSMLSGDRPIWAVAVPITISYEGDAQAGMPVHGCALGGEQTADGAPAAESIVATEAPEKVGDGPPQRIVGDSSPQRIVGDASPRPLAGDHFHGFGQSPQRSR